MEFFKKLRPKRETLKNETPKNENNICQSPEPPKDQHIEIKNSSVVKTRGIIEGLEKSNPELVKEALLCLMRGEVTRSQAELMRHAITSALIRNNEECPFCHSISKEIVIKPDEAKCFRCLKR